MFAIVDLLLNLLCVQPAAMCPGSGGLFKNDLDVTFGKKDVHQRKDGRIEGRALHFDQNFFQKPPSLSLGGGI
jgi:hypothetical protein